MFLFLYMVYLIDKLIQLQSAHAFYFWVDIYHNLATVTDIQAIRCLAGLAGSVQMNSYSVYGSPSEPFVGGSTKCYLLFIISYLSDFALKFHAKFHDPQGEKFVALKLKTFLDDRKQDKWRLCQLQKVASMKIRHLHYESYIGCDDCKYIPETILSDS